MRKNQKSEGSSLPQVSQGPLNELPPQVTQKTIVVNTFKSEYPLIDEVATQVMGWQVIKEEDPNAKDFDLYWNDLTTDSAFLM